MKNGRQVPTWGDVARLFGAMCVIVFGTALMGSLSAGEVWLTLRWGYSTPSMGMYIVMMGFLVVGMFVFSQGFIMSYNSMRGLNDCYHCRLAYCMSPGVRGILITSDGCIQPTKEIPWWSWDDVLAVGFLLWGLPFTTAFMLILHLDHMI